MKAIIFDTEIGPLKYNVHSTFLVNGLEIEPYKQVIKKFSEVYDVNEKAVEHLLDEVIFNNSFILLLAYFSRYTSLSRKQVFETISNMSFTDRIDIATKYIYKIYDMFNIKHHHGTNGNWAETFHPVPYETWVKIAEVIQTDLNIRKIEKLPNIKLL